MSLLFRFQNFIGVSFIFSASNKIILFIISINSPLLFPVINIMPDCLAQLQTVFLLVC